ncbi:MAG: right-handed parallel beta-helix repeat-containing protein [Planctomycetota bacterium]
MEAFPRKFRHSGRASGWALAVLAASLLIPGARAAAIRVPGDVPSIQEAIARAADSDEIVVAPGIYTLSSPLDFLGKAVRVVSEEGPERTKLQRKVVDTRGSVIAFTRGEGGNSRLEGFTITGGSGSSLGAAVVGGGIICTQGSGPTLVNLAVVGNRAQYGGGLYCAASSPTLIDCSLSWNHVTCGGGAFLEASNPQFIRCRIEGNRASYASSGVHSKDGSSPLLDRCRILGNTTYYGGGVDSFQSHPRLVNCIIAGNKAAEGGGAYVASDSGMSFVHCTVAFNVADTGWGVRSLAPGERVSLVNSILLDPRPATSPILTLNSIVNVDPRFVFAGEYDFTRFRTVAFGGESLTVPDFVVRAPDFRLRPDSPAVDAAYGESAPAVDIDGIPRPQGRRADVGAHELTPPPGPFRRGDANSSGTVDIADAVALLLDLAGGFASRLPCESAADANDDGRVDVSDPIFLLRALFLSGPLPPPPAECGYDPTPDDLACAAFPICLD